MKEMALYILDIVQNSVSAEAKIVYIDMVANLSEDVLTVKITDDGRGMDREVVKLVTDPYFTTRKTRKVGLGIPLLKQISEQAGGGLHINSTPGEGTELTATFKYSHIDRPPQGDIAGVISLLAGTNPEMDFVFRYSIDNREYVFDTREIKEVLGEVSIGSPSVIGYMKEMIGENIE